MTTALIPFVTPASTDLPAPIARDRLKAAMDEARAPATRRCYRSQWRVWCAWARERGLEEFPATPAAVANFLLDRADGGVSVSTLRTARAALASRHRDVGAPDPTDNEGVRRVMSGLARTIATSQGQAAALTREVQVAIQATAAFPRELPSGKLETRERARERANLDIALVAVMRDGLLRRSEAAALVWGDVEFLADGSGRLTVRRSKTDQDSQGAVLYLGPEAALSLLTIRRADAGPSATVFGLSDRQISRRIAAAARAAGIRGDFAGHSPRVGMAIDLAASGCELPALMTAGRWESPRMPAKYTRFEEAGRGAVARYYGSRIVEGVNL